MVEGFVPEEDSEASWFEAIETWGESDSHSLLPHLPVLKTEVGPACELPLPEDKVKI